jgi:hypothetical protein
MARAWIVDGWVETRSNWGMRPGLKGLPGLYGPLVIFLLAPPANLSLLNNAPKTDLHERR